MKEFDPDKSLIMSKKQVRSVDSWAINDLGIPGVVLMENAGRGVSQLIESIIGTQAAVGIVCGAGNNGGDGYVIARHLLNSGYNVRVMILSDKDKIKGDAGINLSVLEKITNDISYCLPNDPSTLGKISEFLHGCDILVDAIFGTGLQGQLRPGFETVIESLNQSKVQILAVDIPSGLDCDSGQPLGASIRARWTATFVANKLGFLYPDSKKYTGQVYVVPIGVLPDSSFYSKKV